LARQALDWQARLIILGMQFGLLMQHRPQHLLQQVGVVREGVRVVLHRGMMNEATAPEPDFMAALAMEIPQRTRVCGRGAAPGSIADVRCG
jgi:hypothetical protein